MCHLKRHGTLRDRAIIHGKAYTKLEPTNTSHAYSDVLH